jgi:post-segregation antitoxin (ccd killing protein)
MANANAVSERKTQVISLVPVSVREQVDKLARRNGVSVSEIGRRALSEYVEKQQTR